MSRYDKAGLGVGLWLILWFVVYSIVGLSLVAIAIKLSTDVSADDAITAIPMLSRQEQIQIMKECISDVKNSYERKGLLVSSNIVELERLIIAAAFFEYRTR